MRTGLMPSLQHHFEELRGIPFFDFLLVEGRKIWIKLTMKVLQSENRRSWSQPLRRNDVRYKAN